MPPSATDTLPSPRPDGAPAADSAMPSSGTGNGSGPARRPRRNDIQGIRALCMIQVLLYHAWHVGSPIGVDAFIMISAYLMTGSFLRRTEAGHMPLFLERWANTFKRLLPPLVVVVLVTLWAATRLMPGRMGAEMVTQAFASLGYWENWRLVHNAADYYAMDQSTMSPFQHLWSMSMQGQVFAAWPLLMTVAAGLWVALRKKVSLRAIAVMFFAALTAWSLWWLLTAGAVEPAESYFDTRSRVWEFALGSAIAAAEPWLRRIPRVAPFITWIGLTTLVTYCLVPIGTYPGPMATVPMLAVAMLLVFGDLSKWTPQRVLSWRPLVGLGNISYCVYLVHWPLFIFFLAVVEKPRMEGLDGTVMIALSVVVAYALTKLVDDPARLSPWANKSAWRKGIVVLVSLAIGNGGVFLLRQGVNHRISIAQEAVTHLGTDQYPGAAALDTPTAPVDYEVPPIPKGEVLDREWATLGGKCDRSVLKFYDPADDGASCEYLQVEEGRPTVFVVGDSHEQQLLPQVSAFAQEWKLNVVAMVKGACRLGSTTKQTSQGCRDFQAGALRYVEKAKPEYVVLVSTVSVADSPDEHVAPGMPATIKRITKAGSQVIGVRDNLRSVSNMYDCSKDAVENGESWGCIKIRDEYLAPENPASSLESIKGFHSVDMTDHFCWAGMCPGVIGNVYVYLDHNHVTGSYSKTLGPAFSARAAEAVGLSKKNGAAAASKTPATTAPAKPKATSDKSDD